MAEHLDHRPQLGPFGAVAQVFQTSWVANHPALSPLHVSVPLVQGDGVVVERPLKPELLRSLEQVLYVRNQLTLALL